MTCFVCLNVDYYQNSLLMGTLFHEPNDFSLPPLVLKYNHTLMSVLGLFPKGFLK